MNYEIRLSLIMLILQVADWAKMAFFMYGGEAQYNFSGFRPPGLHNSFNAGKI